jgi:hypothetical protein
MRAVELSAWIRLLQVGSVSKGFECPVNDMCFLIIVLVCSDYAGNWCVILGMFVLIL